MTLPPGGPGRRRIELLAPGQRLKRTLVVGTGATAQRRADSAPVVLATGDSMVETVESVLADRLGGQARVVRQIHPSTGISRPDFDWPAEARKQAKRLRPAVTVVFVGVSEGFAMMTPSGERVQCCREAWTQEYTRRAGAMMRAYGRGGDGQVVWITVPAARNPELRAIHTGVNTAVEQAAASAENASLVHLDRVLTPNFEYQQTIRWGGRDLRVRAEDGVHLSVAGARIAVNLLMRTSALARLRR